MLTHEEIVHRMWRSCFYRCRLESPEDYMQWRAMVELKWSGRKLDPSNYESFLESLDA